MKGGASPLKPMCSIVTVFKALTAADFAPSFALRLIARRPCDLPSDIEDWGSLESRSPDTMKEAARRFANTEPGGSR